MNKGLNVVGVLTIVFVILKLTSVISWSWLWVLSPLWMVSGLFIILYIVVLLVIFIRNK